MEKCYHTQLLIYYRKSRHSSEAVFAYTVYSDIFIVRFLFSTTCQKETLRGVNCVFHHDTTLYPSLDKDMIFADSIQRPAIDMR